MQKRQRRRILVLGTTYPSHSKKYKETVCTGGIFEDTLEMCRLYPVPIRYLEPSQRFHAFQFIEGLVERDTTDPRPESYRIDKDSLIVQETIPPKNHSERRRYLEESPHFCRSVEELKERQKSNGTSLGIIVPESILDCSVKLRPEAEREEWRAQEEARAAQERLFGEPTKPLDFPEAIFLVKWKCDDEACAGHEMGLHQWGIHELYRKYRDPNEAREKVIQKMQQQLDQWQKDVFLFLGNFRTVPVNFGLMDSYSAPARLKSSLFK